jgi:hypothetical protein
MNQQNGSVLVIVILIMALLAAAIIGLTSNVNIDLFVGRNARILKQSFLWGDSGLEITERLINNSAVKRGATDNSTDFITNPSYRVDFINPPLYTPNGTSINFSEDGTTLSTISINFLGRFISDGNSIKFENAGEGVGFGAGSGAVVGLVYNLNATGFTDNNQSLKRAAEIYTYVVN